MTFTIPPRPARFQSCESLVDMLYQYVVYISEFDFLKGGLTTYHVDKVIRENGVAIDDGLHEIYVNTVVDDGTDIADLINCFVKKEFNNPKFPNYFSGK